MKRIASSSAVAIAPTYSADAGTPGHFAESPSPTHLTAKFCEGLQEGHVRTIEDAGETPADDMAQFSNVVAGVHAIKSGATTTGTVTTPRTRAVLASTTSSAAAANSSVVSSSVAVASAAESCVAASTIATASGVTSAVIASAGTGLGVICEASGASSAVIACDTEALASGARSIVAASKSSTASGASSAVIGGESHNATAANSGVFGGYDHDATAARAVCVGGSANNASAADAATLGGSANNASGTYSAAIGGATNTASGSTAACVGGGTSTASGQGAVTAGAYASTASGTYSGVLACDDATAGGNHSAVVGSTSASTTSSAIGSVLLASENAKLHTALAVAGGYSASAVTGTASNQHLTWKIKSSDGSMIMNSTLTQSGDANADYAEMFENAAAGVIPPGSLLARDGRRVRLALPGDRVAGVVSAAPAVLAGGTGELGWAKQYETDEWGRVIFDQVELVGADGNVTSVAVPRVSARFDATREHTPRTARPAEWTPVALMGQVRVRIGDGVQVDDLLAPGPNGCAVATTSPKGRPVEVMEITTPFTVERGYGVALCLVG